MWNRFARFISVTLCVLLVSSAFVVFLPSASADVWKEGTDADFIGGDFLNSEIVGTGDSASIQLEKTLPNWLNLSPDNPPPIREGAASCFSTDTGKMIIFGGYTSGSQLNDTWEYDYSTNTWTDVSPAISPSAREMAGMTYASDFGVCVLFSGLRGTKWLDDTWVYDSASQTWTNLTSGIKPSQMNYVHLAYYTSAMKVILLGQTTGDVMETWSYNPELNLWEDRGAANHPSTRTGYAMAHHEGIGRIVLYGGAQMLTVFDETWEYDYGVNTWQFKTSGDVGLRIYFAMTYRSSDEAVVLFGGSYGMDYWDDTWFYKYDPTPSWSTSSSITTPAGRRKHVLEYDSINDYVLLFGGWDGNVRYNDTWALGLGYQLQGAYSSKTFYCGEGAVDWGYVWWNYTPQMQPNNTELRIRLASSTILNPAMWLYVGPNGTTSDYYWYPGQEIWDGHDNRTYLRYQVTLISWDGKFSPVFDNITITYNPIPTNPKIVDTYPNHIQLGVGAYEAIVVDFSKAMDTASIILTITPNVTTTPSWTNGDKTLTLSHTDPFQKCGWTTVEITEAYDTGGLPLVDNPDVDNPWSFSIECPDTQIISTDPVAMDTGVPLLKSIVIEFNQSMNTSSVMWTVNPDPGDLSVQWSGGNKILTLSHATPFKEWWRIEAEVTAGKSIWDQVLIPGPVPNPWWFETTGYSPYIESTDPADNETEVSLGKAITVVFSEAMDTGTVNVNITPTIALTESWTGNTQLTLTHATDFLPCQAYTVAVDGKGQDGNDLVERYGYPPNPFQFMTTCVYPYITETRPYHGEEGVLVSKYPQILFSKEMNLASLVWTISPDPDPFGWEVFWLDVSIVQLNHTTPFTYCTEYTMEVVSAKDTSGNDLVPGPAPNPWTFITFSENPCIMDTYPFDGQLNVSLDQDIWVNFSEPIDPSSLAWMIGPPVPGGWTEAWSNGNKTLLLDHLQNFTASTQYGVYISDAKDMDGNDLQPGPVPNSWWFQTGVGEGPYIVYHYPASLQEDILLDADIIVDFSEPMDTPTVTWQLTPDPGGVSGSWSNGDTRLTLSHDSFIECTTYDAEITNGSDMDGYPLQPNPDPFDPDSTNPWDFKTVCVNPYIVSTHPANATTGVPTDQSIMVNFSEAMDTGSVTWTIAPDTPGPGGWTEAWSDGSKTLTLYHNATAFDECTIHEVTVTGGTDLRGLSLVPGPAPNPWKFTTVCLNPYITVTDPAAGEVNVSFDHPITIGFSEPMNESTVTWTIAPGLGSVTEVWNSDSTVLTIYHNASLFLECQDYQVEVTGGEDLDGYTLIPGPDPLPNPWIFTTACIPPYITQTDPPDGQTDVPLNYNVTIWFSEPVVPATFLFSYTPSVPPLGWDKFWYDGNTRVVLTHSTDFSTCTQYTIEVLYVLDEAGLELAPGPVNKWSFMTTCPNPYIKWTDPEDGETNVELDRDIQVNFSDPMNTNTVNWTITPDPGGVDEKWYVGDTLMVLTHSNFTYDTTYTVHVTEGKDKDGYDLIDGLVPNPWQFRTGPAPPPPQVNWTDPKSGDTGVDIWQDVIVSFTKEIVPATLSWTIFFGPNPGGWSESWSQIVEPNDTVTLSHSNPFNELTTFCFRIISAEDVFGQDLPGPYEFCFATGEELSPPGGLAVSRGVGVVTLTWNLVAGATHYNIYDSTDKWAPFPSDWNMNQVIDPSNTYDFSHIGDGLTHYYIVRAYDSGSGKESANSTMGVKIEKDFTINPAQSNIYWMSLPYVSDYQKASDITSELTSGNINVVGKWDRQKQKTDIYFFARGKWRGTDFDINAGDGIYVGVVNAFSWTITGTDSTVTINLPFAPAPAKPNRHWISVPYTGNYGLASDIVADIEPSPGAPTKIVEVGKWDPNTQSVIRYYYDGMVWTGVDFSIEPGDGIYLRVIDNLDWTPELVTPYVA